MTINHPCPDCGKHHNPLDHRERGVRLMQQLRTTVNAASEAGLTYFELLCMAAAIAAIAADELHGGRKGNASALVDMMLHAPAQRRRKGVADA